MTFLLDNLCIKKSVTLKYFVIVLEKKISSVNMGIRKENNILIENVNKKKKCKEFLMTYTKFLNKIKKNIIKFLNFDIERGNQLYSGMVYIDQIIYSGEKIIIGEIITYKLYLNIMEGWNQFKKVVDYF